MLLVAHTNNDLQMIEKRAEQLIVSLRNRTIQRLEDWQLTEAKKTAAQLEKARFLQAEFQYRVYCSRQ